MEAKRGGRYTMRCPRGKKGLKAKYDKGEKMTEKLIETKTVADYAGQINIYAGKTAQLIFKIGETFIEAKDNLPHGEFSKLFELTPFGQRTAQNYMRIAASQKVKELLKNEPDSHLGVKRLLQIATGKSADNKPAWLIKQEENDKDKSMPYIDFWKKENEYELWKQLGISHDFVKLSPLSIREFNKQLDRDIANDKSILEGKKYPVIGIAPGLILIATGQLEDCLIDAHGTPGKDDMTYYHLNRYTTDMFIREKYHDRAKQVYKKYTGLQWLSKEEVIDKAILHKSKMHGNMLSYLLGSYYNSCLMSQKKIA